MNLPLSVKHHQTHPWIRVALFGAMLLHQTARAESSSAVSPAITVDTRDLVTIQTIRTNLKTRETSDGHLLVMQSSNMIGLDRAPEKPAYLQLSIPEFSAKGQGWDEETQGLGVFHGLELVYQGDKNDQIDQKIGGSAPSAETPESEWRKVSPNRILPILLDEETHYFRIDFSEVGKDTAKLEVRFHSARLAQSNGDPVTALNSNQDLWIVIHDADSGAKTLQKLHKALEKAERKDQVVTLDWASAATSSPFWSKPASNAEYFQNLGQNLASLLKKQGFKPRQVHLVGHGWGALIAYETAKRLKGCGRIIAMDPSAADAGAYNTKSVKFTRMSKTATSIKSGSLKQGSIGDETMSTSSDFSIRLLSKSHTGAKATKEFHHALPVDWLIRSLTSKNDPYWPFFRKSILLRSQPQPKLPWESSGTLKSGFHMECHGKTNHDDNGATPSIQASMDKVTHLVIERNNKSTEARATTKDGKTNWKYRAAK